MSAQHTPTPWDVIVSASRLCHVETAHDNPAGAGMPVCSVPVKRAEDAGFIVLACNAHDELVAALAMFERVGYGASIDQFAFHDALVNARAALAKAGAP
jgi:hypothetical protein